MMTDYQWDEIYEIKEEYYLLHSRLINDCLKKCSTSEQKDQLLMMISESNSPYSRKEDA